jgi:hypothetical protein
VIETILRVSAGFGLGVGTGLVAGAVLAALPWVRVVGVPIAQILAPIAPIADPARDRAVQPTGDGAAILSSSWASRLR